jgi:uncharacterized RDD family membrane protein YckC
MPSPRRQPAGYYRNQRLANWPQRVSATLIDLAIGWLLPFILASLVLAGLTDSDSDTNAAVATVFWCIVLGIWFYDRWYLEGKTGQGWGKRMLKLRLVRMSDLQPVGIRRAFGRDLAHFVDYASFFIGFLVPLVDPRRQTFADKITGTVVLARSDAVKETTGP